MAGAIRPSFREPDANTVTLAYGQVARLLLRGQLEAEPRHLWLLHAKTDGADRGEPESLLSYPAVWLRVAWPDGAETLGFCSCADAELVWALYPDRCQWLSRLVGPNRRPKPPEAD